MRLSRVFAALLILIFALGLVTFGCGGPRKDVYEASRGEYAAELASRDELLRSNTARPSKAPDDAAKKLTALQEANISGAGDAGGLGDLAASQPDIYLIKNATITLECDDAKKASETLRASLQSINAYVSNLNEFEDALGRRTVTLQVRVPADKFDQSMLSLETLGRILNKQVSTEDVTEEYVDTDSRTRNLKKTEERLLDHLNRAAQLEDILRVENELTRVREQIERMDGRLRYLKNRVSFSTISITLQEKAKAEPITPTESFSTAKVFTSTFRDVLAFAQGIWSLIIRLLVWSLVYGPIAFVGYIAYKRMKKRNY